MAESTPEPESEQQLEPDTNQEQEDEPHTETESEDDEIINDRYLPRPLTMYELFLSWENQVNHGKLQMDERDMMTDRRIVPFNAHNEEPLSLFAYPTLYPFIRIDYYTQSTYQLNESYLSRFRKLLLIRDLLDIPLDKRDGIISEGGETRFLQLWAEGSEDERLHKSPEDRWYYARELKDQANVEVSLYNNILACILRILREDGSRMDMQTRLNISELGVGCWTCSQTVLFSTSVRAVRLFLKRIITLRDHLLALQSEHPEVDMAPRIPSEEALRFPFLKHYLDQGKKDENERCWDLDLKRVNMWDERFRM
ncbi:uncharacterized protein L199_006840 [Kwoniella botswanensis]|uniref:uncharacterized protein n=1 Tax=Kwoniella botswanensis TaxID=1268659 RepID=UPI00315D7322